MARPKRTVQATIDSTITPPDALPPNHVLAKIVKAEGKNLYAAELPDGKPILAELEAKFRSTVWIKRGGYVLVDTSSLADRENKLDGEIVNVVRDEKAWRKMSYWYVQNPGIFSLCYNSLTVHRPKEFTKKSTYIEDSDEEESTMGKMPPTDSDED
jgi:probable RNA-binding protein EIF1AD